MQVALIYTEADPWALGMRSISAAVARAGHETKMLFIRSNEQASSRATLDKIREIVAGCDVVGISSLARGSEKAKQIIRHLRPTGAFIVYGGIHATLNPEECAQSADVVCRGEGEGFMVELLERRQRRAPWKTMLNAAYFDGEKVVLNPLRPLVEDLDSLPLPDFRHAHQFHIYGGKVLPIARVFDVREPIMFNGSRGCPYPCTYCVNSKMRKIFAGTGRYCRKMSMRKYIESVRELKACFPLAKCVYLIDEDFFARKQEDLDLFAAEFPRQVALPYECMGSPAQCTQEKMDLLVRAGLWRVRVGLESGSDRTKREVYDRHMTNESVMKAARIINRYPKVSLCYFMMIANPYEERDDLLQTARFLADLPYPYYSQIYNLIFLPGTLLYDRAVADGLLSGKTDSAFELDYRAGLNYRKHAWKKKNLYLNALLFLAEGKSTRRRIGLIPRFLLPLLLRPSLVAFNERHLFAGKRLIALKRVTLKLRHWVARFLQGVLRDPTAVYRLRDTLAAWLSPRANT